MTWINLKEFTLSYKDFKALGPEKWMWPLATLILVCLVWMSVFIMLSQAQDSAIRSAQNKVQLNKDELAAQFSTLVDKIYTLSMVMEYEHSVGLSGLQYRDLADSVMGQKARSWVVSVINHNGKVINSNKYSLIGAHFQVNPNKPNTIMSSSFSIEQSYSHPLFNLPTLHFVRGSVYNETSSTTVVVSIPVDAFMDELVLRDNLDFTALSQQGELILNYGSLRLDAVSKLMPAIDTTSDIFPLSGKLFRDGKDHTMAWVIPYNIPLILVVGFDNNYLNAEYYDLRTAYILGGLGTSLLLLIVGALATIMYGNLIMHQASKQELEAAYRSATESAMDGFFILKPIYATDGSRAIINFIVEDCNRRGAAMLGWSKTKLLQSMLSDIVSFDMFQVLLRKYSAVSDVGLVSATEEFYFDSPKPAELKGRWVSHRCIYSKAGIAITLRDITEDKQHMTNLRHAAEHDAVTELPNRKWLTSYMPSKLDDVLIAGRKAFFLFVDLDKFKQVNDNFGHDAGDELLRAVGTRLKQTLRSNDIVVRLGGDEFVIAIYQNADQVDIDQICQRILAEMHRPFELNTCVAQIGASIGVSIFPDLSTTLDEVLGQADIAMYRVKRQSRGNYCIFSKDLLEEIENTTTAPHSDR